MIVAQQKRVKPMSAKRTLQNGIAANHPEVLYQIILLMMTPRKKLQILQRNVGVVKWWLLRFDKEANRKTCSSWPISF